MHAHRSAAPPASLFLEKALSSEYADGYAIRQDASYAVSMRRFAGSPRVSAAYATSVHMLHRCLWGIKQFYRGKRLRVSKFVPQNSRTNPGVV